MGSEEEAQEDVQGQVLNQTLAGLAARDDTETAPACCVICLAEISEPCTAKPCEHNNFDFLCLASWLQQKTSCPLCKAEITQIHYGFTDEGKSWKTYRVPKIGLEPAPADSSEERRQFTTPSHRFRGRLQSSRGSIRRTTPPAPSDPEVRAQLALERRRHVYRAQLYSLHVGSNTPLHYTDISTRQFQTDPDLTSRARAWIRRELQVFEFLSRSEPSSSTSTDGGRRQRQQNNFEFILEYVIAILKTVDLQASSGHAENLLSDFLGRENCRLFLHELRSFLRSPFSLEAWDRHVQYNESRVASSSTSRERSQEVAGHRSRGARPMGDRYRPRTLQARPRQRSIRHSSPGRHLRRGGIDSLRPG